MTDEQRSGRCECGAVAFETRYPLRDVIACHCKQCRRSSGHYWAATAVDNGGLTLILDDGLRWYRSSESAQRGFCGICGSSLFWKQDDATTTSIAPGALEGPTGLRLSHHIFVKDKGDYYDIACQADQIGAAE